jgi:hypothetical protein
MAGFVVNPGPNVVVPVTVTNFVDIGAISLTLNYNVSIAQITSISPNVNLPGFTADWTTNPGRIIMGWYGSSGVTLPDNAHIVDISFTGLVAGETALTWLDNGGSCEYAKFDGGAFNVLPDSPTSEYYKNGYITCNQYGPVTVAPVFSPSAPDQDICIPIKIYQGTDVGAISLTLYYDPSILVFQGINTTTIPNTWSFIGQASDLEFPSLTERCCLMLVSTITAEGQPLHGGMPTEQIVNMQVQQPSIRIMTYRNLLITLMDHWILEIWRQSRWPVLLPIPDRMW